jgi:nitroreductase
VGLSSIHWREAWKYGERAFRYCQHDVGHALATMRISAAALGWRLFLFSGANATTILGEDNLIGWQGHLEVFGLGVFERD